MPKEQQAETVNLAYTGPDDDYHTAGREYSFVRGGEPVPVPAELAEQLMALRYKSPLHRFEVRPTPERPAAAEPVNPNPPMLTNPGEASSEQHTLASQQQQERDQAGVEGNTAKQRGK